MPECHSTNDIAADIAKSGSALEGTIVVTDHQTKGRGQRGNTWLSAKGENITFSVILKPSFLNAADHFQLHYIASLAVFNALKAILRDVKIKWPNDILVKRKKICGILIENSISKSHIEMAIIGIGLNVNQTDFVDDRATSLKDLTGLDHNKDLIMASLCEELEATYLSIRAGNLEKLRTQYLRGLFQYNELALYSAHGETFSGNIRGIDAHGRLMIERAGEVQHYDFKEVSFLY
jgi:BirA family biotin operon repressor/biotin-[acetyl-CoA-carboxylase] ligase